VHKICINPVFDLYPDFIVEPYRFTVTIKTDDGFNNKPFWNNDFETLKTEQTLQLEDTISLNYTALDIDPEDIIRSRISEFGNS